MSTMRIWDGILYKKSSFLVAANKISKVFFFTFKSSGLVYSCLYSVAKLKVRWDYRGAHLWAALTPRWSKGRHRCTEGACKAEFPFRQEQMHHINQHMIWCWEIITIFEQLFLYQSTSSASSREQSALSAAEHDGAHMTYRIPFLLIKSILLQTQYPTSNVRISFSQYSF